MLAIGLMSGTSLDGIDAALVAIAPRGSVYELELRRFETLPFDDSLYAALRSSLPPNAGSTAGVAELHQSLGEAFARAALTVAGNDAIGFIASHGQTVFHDGARSVTLQLADPFVIRERLDATVCYDFRSGDCAAGGHGAPLIPYVDALLFGSPDEDRVAINLGGIANVTLLPRTGDVAAFDTGPGNMLIDAYIRARSGDPKRIDTNGDVAAAGGIDSDLLAAMLVEDYFTQPPPKSTGRERFGEHFLAAHRERLTNLSLEDALATLTELTAASIAHAVQSSGTTPVRVIVGGGGARNAHLLTRIAARLSPADVETTDTMGILAEAKEAIGFAVLGYETLRERASNVPRATGATRGVPLGAIAPNRLRDLLAEVDRECRSS